MHHGIHQTCQTPVKNLYETYAGWPRLGAPDCKTVKMVFHAQLQTW